MSKSIGERLRELDRRESAGANELRQRLERLYRSAATEKSFPDEQVVRDQRRIHEYVAGSYENTSFGDVFVARVHYPWDYVHGNSSPAGLRSISGDWLSRLGRYAKRTDFDLDGTIFIDTETTGLAGGSGTLAFLVGIGFVDDGGFTVHQYFADSFNREEGMLDLVADFIKPYSTIISFNGKTYDLPLLATRYVLQRRPSPFESMQHLDLLHLARQIWGYSLQDCRLQTIEREVLDFQRRDDLPGSKVPEAYFKFLRGGGADPLYRVFEHNALDILTLAMILPLVWELTRPEGRAPDLQLARSRILLRQGEVESARQVLEEFVTVAGDQRLRQIGRIHLGRIYKKTGAIDRACRQWRKAIEDGPQFYLEPYEELAKDCEHRQKNPESARDFARQARNRLSGGRTRELHALDHRLERLEDKIERRKQ
ncbi:MAG: ribonuclease H-like domain-containing protein [Candidatus Neomarinimicrobiota bacterium]